MAHIRGSLGRGSPRVVPALLVLAACAVLVAGPVPDALGGKLPAGAVAIEGLLTPASDAAPVLSGTVSDRAGSRVQVDLYAGQAIQETPLLVVDAKRTGGHWTATIGPLPDGTYTAQAVQLSPVGEQLASSAPTTFSVDSTAPRVTVTEPAPGATVSASQQAMEGEAGTEPGDLPDVTVTVYRGAALAEPLESHVVSRHGGRWSTVFAGLAPGAYEARAEQSDEAGNHGLSAAVPFAVDPPGPASPGVAGPSVSFTWLPTAPEVGARVTLVSSATDPQSPIDAYAWALGGDTFLAGGPVATTSFPATGPHIVRLRVTTAAGASGTVARTIDVSPDRLALLQPFPVVRIVGFDRRAGARLRLLSVRAPARARITVRCQGRGCPARTLRRTVRAHQARTAGTVRFHRLERFLPAGVVLVIRVEAPRRIGKYTRLEIRRGRIPRRIDACLYPRRTRPISCPS